MDSIFFYLSKIIWAFISPDSLLLILILATLYLLFLKKYKTATKLLTFVSIILIIIALFPIGKWMLYPLETRFQTNPTLPEKIDGIIVLSGAEAARLSSVWNQVELGGAVERSLYFLSLAKKHPKAKLIFIGGSGSMLEQNLKEADVAKKLYQQQGFDTNRIVFERKSRNTFESAINGTELIQPVKNEKWLLITTAWHMPRSVSVFCKAGWSVIPFPVDHSVDKDNIFTIEFNLLDNLRTLKTAIKEWVGLFAYYVTGKTTAIYPQLCR